MSFDLIWMYTLHAMFILHTYPFPVYLPSTSAMFDAWCFEMPYHTMNTS